MLDARSLMLALVPLALLALPACSARNTLEPGAYTGKAPPASSVTLTIPADKKKVTFTVAGGAPFERSAEAWPPEKWPMLCPRGLKDTRSEVLDLGVAPLVLGPTTVTHPLLVANCLGKPAVDVMSVDSAGEIVKPEAMELSR
ncbi:MAG: hypothetical protein U0359_07020 [Byssovorax sp.]